MSTADLKSRITYCNPAFAQVSGCAPESLIGQPNNLVCHPKMPAGACPDMPAATYRDMWITLKSGQIASPPRATDARPSRTGDSCGADLPGLSPNSNVL